MCLTPLLLRGQGLKFEVASVKERPRDSLIMQVGGAPLGARLNLQAMSLSDLVAWAYDVKIWQVTGGPRWADQSKDRAVLDPATRRFDINAKAEGDGERPREEFRQMLRALLAERFHLGLHREPREIPVYALVPDKKGVKVRESGPEAKGVLLMTRSGRIVADGVEMKVLAGWFSNANGVERPVVDETGLKGRYDFTLEWTNPLAGPAGKDDAAAGPSIFTAMTDQLGLRLEPRKGPVEFLVIDRAELPDEN